MKKIIWVLKDNRIGSNHQLEGVASYLQDKFTIIEKKIEYNKLSVLPNILKGVSLIGVAKESINNLTTPWPDIVLSASRRTSTIARWIKKQNSSTKLVHFLHIGRIGIKDFSFIFVPEHDKNKFHAQNIEYTIGSPHFITKEKLNQAYKKWNEKFNNLPRPITAVIIGGAIKKRKFSIENATALANSILALKEKEGGSLLITTSRRTGKKAENVIMETLKNIPHYAYLWGSKDDNPYLGFLSCSDNLIVTGDSVSMCCEATGTSKPLRIFTGKNWLTKKHLNFVNSLIEAKYATKLEDLQEAEFNKTPLNVAKEIADRIAQL